jgi:hypothetical protein
VLSKYTKEGLFPIFTREMDSKRDVLTPESFSGSRISAAGSIVIKKGRLSKLSPLSGHYRPPGRRNAVVSLAPHTKTP